MGWRSPARTTSSKPTVGTDTTGSVAVPNSLDGVAIETGAPNVIGGTVGTTAGTPPAYNLISGNNNPGVRIHNSDGNTVQGNFIGTNAAGTAAIQNFGEGAITIDTAGRQPGRRHHRGGATSSRGTSAACSSMHRRTRRDPCATASRATSSAPRSTARLPSATVSPACTSPRARNNDVGGSDPGAGNTIQFNKGNGVNVNLDAGPANSILGNSIDKNNDDVEVPNNHELGINLAHEDVTLNDAGDTDTSANDIQNFPESTAPAQGATTTTVFGVLHSNPNEAFRVEVFASPNCDRSGYGEGTRYIGSVDVDQCERRNGHQISR